MALIDELYDLTNQIGNSCCETKPSCSSCSPCPPCTFPFAQVIMTCPPPILAPTRPEPVKPLGLFCPTPKRPLLTQEERERLRYDNFYNNYNMDWHAESPRYWNKTKIAESCSPEKQRGTTVDGKNPCCDQRRPIECPDECPTGFKPCTVKLTPPPCCNPCGVWCAQIQPCPPKPRQCNQFEVGAAIKKDKCKKR